MPDESDLFAKRVRISLHLYWDLLIIPIGIDHEAVRALRQHSNRKAAIMAKIDAYAKNPAAQANNIKKLKGRPDYRLRVGDFRVIFSETNDTITIHDVGPRGGIYD